DFIVLDKKEDKNLLIILERPFLATGRTVIDVYKGELTMRVEDQVISFNVFKKVDAPSNIDDCYRVDLVKESIEDNLWKEAPVISHEASVIHPVDVGAKKAQRNTNGVEVSQHSSNSNPLIEVIEPSFSSLRHHKPDKKDFRK
ncbi:hypothetical protein TorRG33x02_338050, partial [Trema orientale]